MPRGFVCTVTGQVDHGETLAVTFSCVIGSSQNNNNDEPGSSISVHCNRLLRLCWPCHSWAGFRSFFSHPALIALVAVLFSLSGLAFFAGGNLSPGVREARGNRWVIPVFVVIGLVNAYLPAYTDRKELWTIDGDTIRWLGVVLFTAGGALRIWPVFVLGRRFSGLVAIQSGHTLVTNGVCGIVRHPSYFWAVH